MALITCTQVIFRGTFIVQCPLLIKTYSSVAPTDRLLVLWPLPTKTYSTVAPTDKDL